ncbi:MAG: filamentous hemagglutinin, partial [Cyanobacteria bacterium J06638_38]
MASLSDIGQAGNVTIKAFKSVNLTGNPTAIFADAEQGNGGNLLIDTPQLSVKEGAQISTSTFGEGQAGNIEIIADSILLSGFPESGAGDGNRSGIFVSTQSGSAGDAGELVINSDSLIIENGARISANTRGPGQGSKVTLNLERLVVQTGGEIGAGSLVNEDADDNKRGNGGTLNINASDSIEIIGTNNINDEAVNSRIFTLAEGTGNAGELNISTSQLTIVGSGEINASSTGTGAAGTLKINADNIDLEQGFLKATTVTGAGGNIELIVAENLALKNNSLISAAAVDADGGNITIVSGFILGFPSEGLGSDIRTNAVVGRGGDINILTQGVLGFEVSRGTEGISNDTNDIDASSQTRGLDGQVTISSPDTNPLQGANRLPTNPVSADAIASDSCSADGGKAQLIIKGKGGITPEPTTILTADVLVPDGNPITVEREITPNSLLPEKTEQEQENLDY